MATDDEDEDSSEPEELFTGGLRADSVLQSMEPWNNGQYLMSIKGVPPLTLVRVTNREPGERTDHSSGLHFSTPAPALLTLCGWVDVDNAIVDEGEVNCQGCLDVVAAVKEYLQRSGKAISRRERHHGP